MAQCHDNITSNSFTSVNCWLVLVTCLLVLLNPQHQQQYIIGLKMDRAHCSKYQELSSLPVLIRTTTPLPNLPYPIYPCKAANHIYVLYTCDVELDSQSRVQFHGTVYRGILRLYPAKAHRNMRFTGRCKHRILC